MRGCSCRSWALGSRLRDRHTTTVSSCARVFVGEAYPSGHLGSQLEVFILVPPRENIVVGRVEAHAIVPRRAAVFGSNVEDVLHEVGIVGEEIVGTDASDRACDTLLAFVEAQLTVRAMRRNLPYFLVTSQKSRYALPLPTVLMSHHFENPARRGPLKARRRLYCLHVEMPDQKIKTPTNSPAMAIDGRTPSKRPRNPSTELIMGTVVSQWRCRPLWFYPQVTSWRS